ncbi:hypothetical protein PENSPDRAFT_682868 [Peniophora sp. CONT]|nr:hypothetical protein PENSPDRAFT_682868 [Peniophora sp. CONT]
MSNTVSKLTYFLHTALALSFSALMYLYAHPGLLIIATLFSTWIFASYMYSTRTPVPSHFLAALGAVIIPTTSRWPPYYTARMRAALHASRPLLSASRPNEPGLTTSDSTSEVLLELDMDILLMDIAAGRIELRSPDNHLQTLLAGRDIVYTVCEEAGYSTLRIRLVADFTARARAWYTDIAARALPVSEDEAFATLIRTPTHALLDLDVIPTQHIPTILSRLPRNTRAVLLLSSASAPYSPAPAWSPQSPSYSLPALRAYPFTHPRSPSALRTQLPDLLRILAEAGVALEKVEDAGAAYAGALASAADALERKSTARGAFVATHGEVEEKGEVTEEGMRAWRAEVLRGRWEAALVRAGSVRKWAVNVRT